MLISVNGIYPFTVVLTSVVWVATVVAQLLQPTFLSQRPLFNLGYHPIPCGMGVGVCYGVVVCNERFTQLFWKVLDNMGLIVYIIYRNLTERGKQMGLIEFVDECKKVDSRLELKNESGELCAYIGEKSVAVGGYNFPCQAHLITNLMNECGSFD